MTPTELMASLEPMEAWLRTKNPTDIVAKDMMDQYSCLGATFLRENGYPDAVVIFSYGFLDGRRYSSFVVEHDLCQVLLRLAETGQNRKGVTAQQALHAIENRRQSVLGRVQTSDSAV